MLLKKITDFINKNIDFVNALNAPIHIAVAVSGGADSLALTLIAEEFCRENNCKLTAITVDHGLRKEGKIEAQKVHDWLSKYEIEHKTLLWQHDEKPTGNIQAIARAARYELLEDFCSKNNITALLLAHHIEDQAETFMLRLARGSGIYGLAAMQDSIAKKWGKILRPLLSTSRDDLKKYLNEKRQDWIEDPSNIDERYARVRMRSLMPILENEGLTIDRIIKTTKRMDEARKVMEVLVETLYIEEVKKTKDGYGLFFTSKALTRYPQEISLRFLSRCLLNIGGKQYTPRMHSLERLLDNLMDLDSFKGCTLAHCKITKNAQNEIFIEPSI